MIKTRRREYVNNREKDDDETDQSLDKPGWQATPD
jgi:hypothetical protein